MRHNVAERKLGVKTAHRKAMLANLASSLILHDKIETTLTRAKEIQPIADEVVTLSKEGTVHAARLARQILRNPGAVHKAFSDFAKRFENRKGGYTRILKLGNRHGDCAPMAMIEYLPLPHKVEEKKAGKEARAKAKTTKEVSPAKAVAEAPTPWWRRKVLGKFWQKSS